MARTAKDTFPLTLRSDGRYCKKIGGEVRYFGRDRDEALAEYYRYMGVKSGLAEVAPTGLTVGNLLDAYLERQADRLSRGLISPRTLSEAAKTLRSFAQKVGGRERPVAAIRASDFMAVLRSWSKGSPFTVAGHVRRVKAAFNWAIDPASTDDGPLLDELPGWGRDFAIPTVAAFDLVQTRKRSAQFTAAEVRALIDTASPTVKAYILLGINAALIPVDLARLSTDDFSSDGQWLQLPRVKTGQHRKAWIWPETREAIKAAKDVRVAPANPEHRNLLFLTRAGHPVVRDQPRQRRTGDALRDEMQCVSLNRPSQEFRDHCLNQKLWKKHRGFGQLRHLFLTVAESGRDFVAVSKIMGHKVPGVTSHYRDAVGDDRIKAACEVVREWLYPPAKRKAKPR